MKLDRLCYKNKLILAIVLKRIVDGERGIRRNGLKMADYARGKGYKGIKERPRSKTIRVNNGYTTYQSAGYH